LSRDLPRIYRLKNLTKELNSKYSIFPTPSDDLGVQQKLQDRLLIFLPKISTQYDQVRIKLSGDGTRVGRSLHVVNFTFTFIDEKNASSVAGNHSLAILKTSEKYDELASSLQNVLSEASKLQTIDIGSQIYNLEYFLGGDWKFLALVCGIDAANSEYSCIWCKCPNRDRWNMDLEWSVTDVSKGARTIDEFTRLAKLTKSMTRYNCSHPLLFHFIPIHHVVIDSLHLFLRIGDLLINLLIQELRRQDGIDKSSVTKLDRSKQTHIAAYERFLNEQCKISFTWYVDDSKKLKWRDLTGPEKHRLFQKINTPSLFPSILHVERIQLLWCRFYQMIKDLNNDDCDPDSFEVAAKDWVRTFCSIYQTKHVTPYIHAFAMHVPEFVRLYGNITKFTQQGLEKLNDLTTKQYLHSTNHREAEALVQLMEKRNRLEELEAEGYQRQIRTCKCSSCGQIGHNKCTCPAREQLDKENTNSKVNE